MIEKTVKAWNELRFLNPEFLELRILIYALFIFWIFTFFLWYKNRAARTVGSRHSKMGSKLRFCLMLILTVLPLSIIALARPYLPEGSYEFKKGGIELVFIVDDSISTLIQDIYPSRLRVMTREIVNIYSQKLIREGDKASLVLFGGSSLKKLRLSTDLNRFFTEIDKIGPPQTLLIDQHPFDSNVSLALTDTYNFLDYQDRRFSYISQYGEYPPLRFNWNEFNWQPKPKSNRIVIFFGDSDYRFNEYSQEKKSELDKALSEFRRRGLKIFSIGVATRRGREVISVLDNYVNGKHYNHLIEEGLKKVGESRLDISTLNYLSGQTGGRVVTVENSDQSVGEFLREIIEEFRDPSLQIVSIPEKRELWFEFLIAALFFVALAIKIK